MADQQIAVYGCIQKAIGKLAKRGIGKTRTNAEKGYAFRGIEDVYEAVAPVLVKCGLVILPRMIGHETQQIKGDYGGLIFHTVVTAEFDFVAVSDGSKHTVTLLGEGLDDSDKSTPKAMTCALKAACIQVFCIPTGEAGADADERTITIQSEPKAAEPVRVTKVERANTRQKDRFRWHVTFSTGRRVHTYDERLATLCEQVKDEAADLEPPVIEADKHGGRLVEVHRVTVALMADTDTTTAPAGPADGPVF